MFLFDTDILSNLLRRTPSMTLISRLARVPAEEQFTSSITLGELLYGAYRRADGGETMRRAVEERLIPELRVLPFDALAAREYGRLRAELERRGTPIGDADTRIASIALVHGLTVVSGNTRHFAKVPGLPVENWLD